MKSVCRQFHQCSRNIVLLKGAGKALSFYPGVLIAEQKCLQGSFSFYLMHMVKTYEVTGIYASRFGDLLVFT